ncbi:MAG: c-type cytochrome domain-containing protein, partial [Myxococcota bacterium]|nr:c-type cytochrome domain-containing protein [Myxococcota bacterium]
MPKVGPNIAQCLGMFKLAPISVALALLSMLMLNACGTELHLSDGLAQDSHSAEMTSGPAKQNRQQAGSDFGSAAPHSSGEKGEHGPILSTNCDDTTAGFFAQQVWGGFMAARCAQCHSAGGMAQYYFAFEESLSPASIQHNLEILQGYAGSDYTLPDGSTMPYLLAMPTGNVRDADDNVSHSGGVVINEFDHPIEIENFATLIDILRADDVVLDESCEEADPFVDVEVADAAQTYRQATQLLANRMPQEAAHADMLDAELEGVGDELLDAYLDELMSGMMFPEDEDNFYANLMLWFNDRFFTDKYATGYDAVKALDNLNGAVMPEHFPQTRYFYRNFENNIAYYPSITPQNFFYDRINSIFGHDPDGNGAQKSCKSCHDSTPDAGLRLSNYNYSCANNSDNGPVIVPGDHANSLLWQYVSGNAHADSSEVYQLEQNEVDLIAEWIDTYQACHTELQDNDLYSFWSNAKNATAAAIGREPLNLIKHVVKNNRPFSEILTADYALVNSYSAVSYNVVDLRENGLACLYDEIWADEDRSSCSTEPFSALDNFMPAFAEHGFTEPLDADVYLEKQIQNASGDTANFVPHAGVFTTTTFLKRHDTTSANKNRNRATRTIRHFLGLDIYDYIPPPSDGSGSTSSDPACVSCHSKMDPIAELYQNFDNSALYTPNDNASDWDTPGFSKGYFGDFFDGDDGANLQWLGQKISQDPRFGKGIAG